MRTFPAIFFFVVMLCCCVCYAEEPLFQNGVESHAWGTPYAQFVRNSSMECIPNDRFENAGLAVVAISGKTPAKR